MRYLLLISTLVISSVTLTLPSNAFAAKSGRVSHHNKGKRQQGSAKHKEVNPGDVWHRISAGIRIPRPSPEQMVIIPPVVAPPGQAMPSTDNSISQELSTTSSQSVPQTTPSPEDRYTALGRKLLAHAKTEADCEPHQRPTQNTAINTTIKTRIRTQYKFQPELRRHINSAEKLATYKYLAERDAEKNAPCSPVTAPAQLSETAVMPPPANANLSSISTIENREMEALALQQRELAAQKNAKLQTNIARVNKYIDWYGQRRFYLYEVAGRAQPYLYHIVDSLSKHKLPLDLALLPIVESAYQPTAKSPMSAAGLWQFMPATGEEYNLKQDSQYDERLDISASTQAAISYLSFLHQRFKGDWLLALAAYNCGIGRVESAISRNLADGLETDYWSLQLPEETQEYVPRFLALTAMFANPATHNLKLSPVRNEPYFIPAKIDREEDLKILANKEINAVAKLANLSPELFKLLNPGYLQMVVPSDRPLRLNLPIPNLNQLQHQLSLLATLENIHQKEVPTLSTSKSSNDLTLTTPLFSTANSPYLSLNIEENPNVAQGNVAENSTTAANKDESEVRKEDYLRVYYLDRGETLQTTAKQFGVNLEALRKLNKLKAKDRGAMGQRLIIPPKIKSPIMQLAKATS